MLIELGVILVQLQCVVLERSVTGRKPQTVHITVHIAVYIAVRRPWSHRR